MPEDAIEFWDVSTRTYYERQEDGTVLSRPYNEAENAQADARANRAILVEDLAESTLLLSADNASNAAFSTLVEVNDDELRAQVNALTAQSSRQADVLAAMVRFLLGRFESLATEVR
ncbi:hypothetical protein [Streptomyces sp. NPDC058603]